MKKIVVVYRSQYGFTKQYAQWLSEDLSCDSYEAKDFSPALFDAYDCLIYGGGLYAEKVNGLDLFKRCFARSPEKAFVLFATGLSDPNGTQTQMRVRQSIEKSLPDALLKKLALFYLHGGMDCPHLSLLHRGMMKVFRAMMQQQAKKQPTAETQLFLPDEGERVDYTKRAYLLPLLAHVKGL